MHNTQSNKEYYKLIDEYYTYMSETLKGVERKQVNSLSSFQDEYVGNTGSRRCNPVMYGDTLEDVNEYRWSC